VPLVLQFGVALCRLCHAIAAVFDLDVDGRCAPPVIAVVVDGREGEPRRLEGPVGRPEHLCLRRALDLDGAAAVVVREGAHVHALVRLAVERGRAGHQPQRPFGAQGELDRAVDSARHYVIDAGRAAVRELGRGGLGEQPGNEERGRGAGGRWREEREANGREIVWDTMTTVLEQ